MTKMNGPAYPLPPYGIPGCPMPRYVMPWMTCCDDEENQDMHYVGKRKKEWLENKVDAKYGETYLCEEDNVYWMSIGANEWKHWQGLTDKPAPQPTKEAEIYLGGLIDLPEDESALDELEKKIYTTEELIKGITTGIATDDAYVTIAYKASVGPISSIKEDGFEAISDFEQFEIGDYVFYCTSDTVYDPDAEINYEILWGIN